MNKTELDHLNLLLKHEWGSVIVAIEPDDTIFEIMEDRNDLVLFVISDENVVDDEDAISIYGNALKIARKWQFAFEILFVDNWNEDEYQKLVRPWVQRIVHQGIAIFNNYDHPDYPYIKTIVDHEMKKYEPIMKAGYLVAYRIYDKLTADTWKMATTIPASAVVQ